MINWKVLYRRLLRRLPRQRHLEDTLLHRVVGQRLFDPALWKPSRTGLAGGFALGTFIALTPTIGIQMALATICAYFLRVNIPSAVAACWITNPLTAPVVYLMHYELGLWLGATPSAAELAGHTGVLQNFVRYARPLWVGSLISGIFSAAVMYGTLFWGWGWVANLRLKRLEWLLSKRLDRLRPLDGGRRAPHTRPAEGGRSAHSSNKETRDPN
ncbi:MAG: DUF2062 domain-containing protein [Nitrospiria bacterium]